MRPAEDASNLKSLFIKRYLVVRTDPRPQIDLQQQFCSLGIKLLLVQSPHQDSGCWLPHPLNKTQTSNSKNDPFVGRRG
jgi:hypothetical protein